MIVIVEGIDRVGKTTLCNKFVERGFKLFKDTFILNYMTLDTVIEKFQTSLHFLKLFQHENIVIDRFHLTEYVYGFIERHYTSNLVFDIDAALAEIDARLVLVNPVDDDADLDRAEKTNGSRLVFHYHLFNEVFGQSNIPYRYICNFETLDDTVDKVLSDVPMYFVYFASPFFNDEQLERESWLINKLRQIGFSVFSPRENIHLKPNATLEEQQSAFAGNIKAIDRSDFVFVVTDGKDIGTIWEAGYAYAKNKPIVYFCETLGPDGKFNVMLAQSGRGVLLSRKDCTWDNIFKIVRQGATYKGAIE